MPFSDFVQNLITFSVLLQIILGGYFALKAFYYVALTPFKELNYKVYYLIYPINVIMAILCFVPIFGSIGLAYFVAYDQLTEKKRAKFYLTY